jgi:hypothetical protein
MVAGCFAGQIPGVRIGGHLNVMPAEYVMLTTLAALAKHGTTPRREPWRCPPLVYQASSYRHACGMLGEPQRSCCRAYLTDCWLGPLAACPPGPFTWPVCLTCLPTCS